jgi:choline kinase
MTTMIMPMAGQSKRTRHIFDGPKALIEIKNYPMFYWASKNIKSDKKVFIVRHEDILRYNIEKIIKNYFDDCIVISQKENLSGPLLSTLLAKDYIIKDESIIIADCDMYSNFNSNIFIDSLCDGAILTFNSSSPNYSYVLKNNKYVTGVIEKKPVSKEAIGGLFYWKDGQNFLDYAEQVIDKNKKYNEEYYISSVYDMAIKDNRKILTFLTDTIYDLSTKEGIDKFLKEGNNAIS